MSKWISVEDELPQYLEVVNIKRYSHYGEKDERNPIVVTTAQRLKTDISGEHWNVYEKVNCLGVPYVNQPFGEITHWMPLPK